MLRVIFWVVPWRVVFNSRRFGILCLFHLYRRMDIHSPIKMEQTQRFETSVIKQHTPGNNPKDYTQQHGLTTEECSSNPERIKKLFVLRNVQTDTVARSVSYSMDNYGSFQGNKQTKLETCNSAIFGKVKSESRRNSNVTYVLMTYTGKTTFSCLPSWSISINVSHSLR
jgi:hypothetical protein